MRKEKYMTRPREQTYLVARGGACRVCRPYGWRAFRDPEDRDLMSPCTREPIYVVVATGKQKAVAIARARFAANEERRQMTRVSAKTSR